MGGGPYIKVGLGEAAPPISEQVQAMGLRIGDTAVLEEARRAIAFLSRNDFMTGVEMQTARRRILRRIELLMDDPTFTPPPRPGRPAAVRAAAVRAAAVRAAAVRPRRADLELGDDDEPRLSRGC